MNNKNYFISAVFAMPIIVWPLGSEVKYICLLLLDNAAIEKFVNKIKKYRKCCGVQWEPHAEIFMDLKGP